jgi:hypothetical protein
MATWFLKIKAVPGMAGLLKPKNQKIYLFWTVVS